MLQELTEPNRYNGIWYFPPKNLRTLQSLAALGLARYHDDDQRRYGYSITNAGRAALKTDCAG